MDLKIFIFEFFRNRLTSFSVSIEHDDELGLGLGELRGDQSLRGDGLLRPDVRDDDRELIAVQRLLETLRQGLRAMEETNFYSGD